jgi:N-methylhydantoinase B/oxoprolinase/acetone carboxylase alpha subunit
LCAHPFSDGETFMFESTGGGGYGRPWERDPQAVLEDVLDEYVSVTAARERYGVVIDPVTSTLDEAATLALRQRLAA